MNDGSTDRSGTICNEYVGKDHRIKVIHKIRNKGLSCARNDGIEISAAPFIMFVDGDDWVEPCFCELPYTLANNTDAVFQLKPDAYTRSMRNKSYKYVLEHSITIVSDNYLACSFFILVQMRAMICLSEGGVEIWLKRNTIFNFQNRSALCS